MTIIRQVKIRQILGSAALALATAWALLLLTHALQVPARAADRVVRIGYQKYGNFILSKGTGAFDKTLAAQGVAVEWTEFPSGPPLLEALNAGAIDIGQAGEAPPIFAQAANAGFVYIAHEPPAPQGEAILVPKDSAIKSVADLKGKKVALNKGSNVHYLLVKLLQQAGVKYSEIQPVFLAPADARAAFETGTVDAWAIWDPYQAAAEVAIKARTLEVDKIFAKGGGDKLTASGPHCAAGEIDFGDGTSGVLLYVKASLTGDENDYVLDYKGRNPDFPHETTGDQFFGEEQFEVYRALGFHITQRVLSGDDPVSFGDPATTR